MEFYNRRCPIVEWLQNGLYSRIVSIEEGVLQQKEFHERRSSLGGGVLQYNEFFSRRSSLGEWFLQQKECYNRWCSIIEGVRQQEFFSKWSCKVQGFLQQQFDRVEVVQQMDSLTDMHQATSTGLPDHFFIHQANSI